MPRLAIVISALGPVESLETTLVSVLENRPDDCEIIVALGATYADPYELAGEVRFLPPRAGESTSAALNRALATTRAPFVHVLAAGCQVSEGWADAALLRFGAREVGSVVPLVWDVHAPRRLLAAGVGYQPSGRRFLVARGLTAIDPKLQAGILGPSGIAGFYRKAALDFIGGFCTRLGPRQADADAALLLRQAGFATVVELRSNIQAPRAADACPGPYRHSLGAERLFWRNWTGPGRGQALAAHCGRVAWELAASFARPRMLAHGLGRLQGALEVIGHARHRRAVAELAARAVRPVITGEQVRIDFAHRPAGQTVRGQARERQAS